MTAAPEDEWRRGRAMVLAAFVGAGLSSAPIYSLGVFAGPLESEFGWPRAQVIVAQALVSVMIAVVSPFVGIMVDRHGSRPAALLGTIIVSGAIASLSQLQQSYAAYLFAWTTIGLGIGLASTMVWLRGVTTSFTTHRGLALSVALCGSSVGGAMSPALTAAILTHWGWRAAYIGLSVYLLLTIIPIAWFCFRDPKPTVGATQREKRADAAPLPGVELAVALRSRNFWLLALAFMVGGGGITSFIVHLVPILTGRGMPPLQAATVVSWMSIAALGGRLASGALMDRVFATRLGAAAMFLPVPACAILLFGRVDYPTCLAVAALLGVSTGAEFNMISFLTARYFGLRHFGALSGMQFTSFTIGSIFLPATIGVLSHGGDYSSALTILAALFAAACLAMLLCTRYPAAEPALVRKQAAAH